MGYRGPRKGGILALGERGGRGPREMGYFSPKRGVESWGKRGVKGWGKGEVEGLENGVF